MDENPFEARQRGTRRVRAVTAWLAGAAAVGTGVVAVAVAESHPAQAASTPQPAQQAPAQQAQQAPAEGDSGQVGSGEDDGGFQQPVAPPGGTFDGSGSRSGHSHASSGGS